MDEGETISVTLPADLVRTIREKVAGGAYASAGELVAEVLRDWQDEQFEELDLPDWMRERIQQSLEDPRPSRPIEEVFERLERSHAEQFKPSGGDA
jgi:antitoxin ParD1/3/4